MENIIYLQGKDYHEDKEKIGGAFLEKNPISAPVFVYVDQNTELHSYIEYLHDECELSNKILSQLKICKEMELAGNVTLADPGNTWRPSDMGTLLGLLRPGTSYHLVIENNDRVLLANIIQQLIYIDYPIIEIDFKLRKEYKDAYKTQRFMKYVDELSRTANDAVSQMKELQIDSNAPNHEELQAELEKAIKCYEEICSQIDKARNLEMKVAVAASKKTGKSVIANCMFGMQLAPTSLELATPNSCIYKKSADNQFHLEYEDQMLDFPTAAELFKRIQAEFKKAQDNKADGYAIPDMVIHYVSNGNNFESFTVYDTPGPDASGTTHYESAEKAINLCDVAIFGIDYSKYLIPSEKEYLDRIKKIFTEKQKFHTLVFALNKMDLALQDDGTKSRVKSIDFIRCRLREIDPQYGDCVIFATSAQDYFYTLELQNSDREELSSLFEDGANWYLDLRRVSDDLELDNSKEAEKLGKTLSNLDGEVSRLHRQLGYRNINHETIQTYSGIPQLLNYVSYIAQSKAREEIVNNITFTIDKQCKELGVQISKIDNVKSLMNKTQGEIEKITTILADYKQKVEETLASYMTAEDAEYLDSDGLLAGQAVKYMRQENRDYPIELSDLLQKMRKDIGSISDREIQKELWARVSSEQKKRIRKVQGQVIEKQDMAQNKLSLELTQAEMQGILRNYITELVDSRTKNEQTNIEKIKSDLEKIVDDRLSQVSAFTEDCRQALDKNDCSLLLPELPEFNAAISQIDSISQPIYASISFRGKLGDIYRPLGDAEQAIDNVFDFVSDLIDGFGFDAFHNLIKKEVQIKTLSEAELDKVVDAMYKPFTDGLDDANVYDIISQALESLQNGVQVAEDKILGEFQKINRDCISTISEFQKGIDDRDRYKEQLDDLQRMENLIAQIQAATKKADSQDIDRFFDIWERVLEG